MILIALGSNLPHPRHGPPEAVLRAALAALAARGIVVEQVSVIWRTVPVPPSGQPDYANAVARVATDLSPMGLLATLHQVEEAFGRIRAERNEARVLDLDLIDHDGRVWRHKGAWPVLPHPRAAERGFVLHPLAEVAPDWVDPVSGQGVAALIAALPPAG